MKFWEADLLYHRGCEEDVGDWQPKILGEAMLRAVNRICHLTSVKSYCESQIEIELGAAILIVAGIDKIPVELQEQIGGFDSTQYLLVPQFSWSFYRSDWALFTPKRQTLLIECDGRDFHSSPAQISHDARKDALAVERGYRTIRFTGAQIYNDHDDCARKVLALAASL